MTFGDKLQQLRKQASLTQKELATKLCLTRQAIAKWENGAGLPDIDNLIKISKFFNTTLDELLDYKIETVELKVDDASEQLNRNDVKQVGGIKELIISKFPKAIEIYKLEQEINLKIWQEIVYSLFNIDVVLELHDFIQNGVVYSFYIEEENYQYLVLYKKSTLFIKRLDDKFKKRHLIVDGYRYTKDKKLK